MSPADDLARDHLIGETLGVGGKLVGRVTVGRIEGLSNRWRPFGAIENGSSRARRAAKARSLEPAPPSPPGSRRSRPSWSAGPCILPGIRNNWPLETLALERTAFV